MRLILASTSPRRKDLLALLGYPFDVVPPVFTECLTPGQPADTQAKEFAFQKAASCVVREPDATVLGSDTVIALDEEVIGKHMLLLSAPAQERFSEQPKISFSRPAARTPL